MAVNYSLVVFVFLGLAAAVQSLSCSAQWQCSSVTTDYNYVACNTNGVCECRIDLGFAGAATTDSKCACNSPNTVIWQSGSPYCVNLQNAVNEANQLAREALLKQKVVTIYQNLVGITPRIIAASGQPLNDLFDINAVGRVTPVGKFGGLVLQQYFYALAAGSFVSQVNFINLKADGNTVTVRVDINFQPPNQFPRPEYNLTQTGFFHFNDANVVVAADLSILNLGAVQDFPPELYSGAIQGLCLNIVGNPQTPEVPGRCIGANQQYADFPSCVAFLSSIPFGSFNRANSNTVVCRLIHNLMVSIPPVSVGANVHCPHVGPTGGGMCVDFPYESFYTADVVNPAGFP